jgi:hypothetical protein
MATKIPHPPPPESHDQHHDRALGQQLEGDMVSVLVVVGWKLVLSRCVELMPTRETDGDESAMNL